MITTDSHNLIYMNLKCLLCGIAILVCVGTVKAIDNVSERVSASISLKVPGNEALHRFLLIDGEYYEPVPQSYDPDSQIP